MSINKKLSIMVSILGLVLIVLILVVALGGSWSIKNFALKKPIGTSIITPGDSTFKLSLENSYSISDGDTLEIPIDVSGASTSSGKGVIAVEITVKNLPSFLSGGSLAVSDSDWIVNDPVVSGSNYTFTANGASSPLKSSKTGFFTLSFNVGTAASGSFNMDLTLSDNNLPSQSHDISIGQITLSKKSNDNPFSLVVPSSIEVSSSGQLVLPIGLKGSSSVADYKTTTIVTSFASLPSYINPSDCSASTALSKWSASSAVKNNILNAGAYGNQNPLTQDVDTVFTLTCDLGSDVSDATIKISGTATSETSQNYDLAQKSISLVKKNSSNYTISGTISGDVKSGVKLTCGSYSSTSGTDGAFTISNVPDKTACTLTPALSGYTFSPTTRSVTVSGANVTGQNFVATATSTEKYSITGTISGDIKSGVSLICGDYTATSGSEGAFTISNVPDGTSCTLTPSLSGYTFSPINRSVAVDGTNVVGQNFVATLLASGLTISGTISGDTKSGVLLMCGVYNDVSDSSGNYSIINVPSGTSCTLIPVKSGYTFSPETKSVSLSSSNSTGNNFVATSTTGDQGEKGDKGDKGDRGKTGAKGDDGKDGKDGKTVTATAPQSGPAENFIIASAIILGLIGATVFAVIKLKF